MAFNVVTPVLYNVYLWFLNFYATVDNIDLNAKHYWLDVYLTLRFSVGIE